MNRREIRYLLSRMKSEVEGLSYVPKNVPEGFYESFECQSKFRGWMSFGISWDVGDTDPWTIVFRVKSLEQEWNEELAKVVPELPVTLVDEEIKLN